jgi:hypothetical protein
LELRSNRLTALPAELAALVNLKEIGLKVLH